MKWHHLAYGLKIRSDLRLPMLRATPKRALDSTVDLSICREKIAELGFRRGDVASRKRFPWGAHVVEDTTSGALIVHWPDIVSFRATVNSLNVAPARGVNPLLLARFVVGSGLGVCLQLRNITVFHGSAVAIRHSRHGYTEAIAFLAPSGVGKSTVAAALANRGHRLITDDVVAVDTQVPDRRPMVHPGYPETKLCEDSAEHLDIPRASPSVPHPQTTQAKWGIDQTKSFCSDAQPLNRIYLLSRSHTELSPCAISAPIEIQANVIIRLIAHSYVPTVLTSSAEAARSHLFQCERIVRQVPIYQLAIPNDLSQLNEVCELIESHETRN